MDHIIELTVNISNDDNRLLNAKHVRLVSYRYPNISISIITIETLESSRVKLILTQKEEITIMLTSLLDKIKIKFLHRYLIESI